MSGLAKKEQAEVLEHLAAQGCTIKPTKNGWQVYLPNGSILGMHVSESDQRSWHRKRARVRRAGLTWPGDRELNEKQKEVTMTAPSLDEKRSYNYNGSATQRLASFFDGFEGDRIRSREVIEQTGVSQPTVTKFLREQGWELVGKTNQAAWVKPAPEDDDPSEGQDFDWTGQLAEKRMPVADGELRAATAGPVEIKRLDELNAEQVTEVTEQDEERSDDAYQLGEAAGYEQAHNELIPQIEERNERLNRQADEIDKLKQKLHEKTNDLNDIMSTSLQLVEQHEALKLSFDNKVKELEQERLHVRTLEQNLDEARDERNAVEALVEDGTWTFNQDVLAQEATLTELDDMLNAAGLEYEIKVWRKDGKA